MKFLYDLKFIKWKVKAMNHAAQNPFTDKDYSYNPFESVFNRTYVWVEEHNEKHRY